MGENYSSQHYGLQVASLAGQILDRISMTYPGNILVNDRSLVQFLGRIMSGGTDQFDSSPVGLDVGPATRKRGQEGMMDVNDPVAVAIDYPRTQHLHVAG